MRKIKYLFLLSVVSTFSTYAQCFECFGNKKYSTIGINLFSNMQYSLQEQIYQPIEFCYRYNNYSKWTYRVGVPIVFKQDIVGEPISTSYTSSLDKYISYMHNENSYSQYNSFFRVLNNYYNLFGLSLGIDYGLVFKNNISAFVGCDMGYYRQNVSLSYYRINNSIMNDNDEYKFQLLEKRDQNSGNNTVSLKPQVGLRFSINDLIVEASIAYHVSYNNYHTFGESNSWKGSISQNDKINFDYSENFFSRNTNNPNVIVFDFRILYNLIKTY